MEGDRVTGSPFRRCPIADEVLEPDPEDVDGDKRERSEYTWGVPPSSPSILERYRTRSRKGARPPGRPGPWVLLAAWGPCGYAPVVPGTFGTAGAVPLAWALAAWGPWAIPAAAAVLLAVGIPAADRAGRYWGVADASPIVIDEVVGYLITMTFVPFTWPAALAGFVLFRVFDVAKPWPASAFDRVKTGFGVMMDDVAAGVWARVALGLGLWALRHLAAGA